MPPNRPDLISPDAAVTLDGLFRERVRRAPDAIAYRYFDDDAAAWRELSWAAMASEIARWQAALRQEPLQAGDRVALMLKNSPTWVMFDQAALSLGLVTVPLYIADRPDNIAFVLQDSGAKLLLLARGEHWRPIRAAGADLSALLRVVALAAPAEGDDARLRDAQAWLPQQPDDMAQTQAAPEHLASIVYTSGTTGRPKGVMLSHRNLLSNAWHSLQSFEVLPTDSFLSFLPLSHMLERTAGYYIPVMAGATVSFARSFQHLQEDLATARPSVLISVPRIYERIYAAMRAKLAQSSPLARGLFRLAVEVGYRRFERAQGRAAWRPSQLLWPLLKRLVADKLMARLGGRLRLAISGGAALSPDVARIFIGLGLPILQGYGLTETSPVVSVNRLRDNRPASVGLPIPGIEVRLDEGSALHVRGHCVMRGYWHNDAATHAMIADDGWLNTGDIAHIDDAGHITITGRIKDIIVLSNGEKVPPVDLEAAILRDALFEQVMVVGEGKPYLSLFAVVNREQWQAAAVERNLPGEWPDALTSPPAQAFALARIARQLQGFPGYTRIRRAALLAEPWSVDNGLLTPTLKLKRAQVLEHYRQEYAKMYAGYSQ